MELPAGDTFFLDDFAARQWLDAEYVGTRLTGGLPEMAAFVAESEYVTFRDLRRNGFQEAEVRQLCELSGGELEQYTHTPPGGGTPSPRVRLRAVAVSDA